MGACSVYTLSGTSPAGPFLTTAAGLDAGSPLTVTEGNSEGSIDESSTKGQYSASFLLPAGSATVAGSGGNDVGKFSVTLPLGTSTLNWTNESSVATITRADDLSITWSGGDVKGTVEISGYSVGGSSAASALGAGFICTAPAAPGQLTVPSLILTALPPSSNFSNSILSVSTGSLRVGQAGTLVPFTAVGLDLGFAWTETSISNSTVTYQ